jgi:N-methylhydantoinase B
MNHFTPGTPVEIIETEYPVMVRRYDIWRDSAGPGRQRGGIGNVREYQVLVDCILTARTSNHRQGAWGLNGGEGPPLSRTVINPDTPQTEEMDCMETRTVPAGTVRRREQTGGGGYGDPRERPQQLVLQDIADGYISQEAAAAHYGHRAVDDDPKRESE